ncbi:hypothetical protein KCP74_02830 [Salmonella enterica subsp. enterica]|nr:hypothetical protein KCP74_02830 [Salmonella enterica subsp. enterica]
MAHHSALFASLNASRATLVTDKAELLTLVYLMTTLMTDVPATTGKSQKYTAHGLVLNQFSSDVFRHMPSFQASS